MMSKVSIVMVLAAAALCVSAASYDLLGYGLSGGKLYQFDSNYTTAELADTEDGWSVAAVRNLDLVHVLLTNRSGGLNVYGIAVYKRTGPTSVMWISSIPVRTGFPQRGSPKLTASDNFLWLHADLHFWRINPVDGEMRLWGDDHNCGTPGAPLNDNSYVWMNNCNNSVSMTIETGAIISWALPAAFLPTLGWDLSVSPAGVVGMVLNVGFDNAITVVGPMSTMPWTSSASYIMIREKIGCAQTQWHDRLNALFVNRGIDSISMLPAGATQYVEAVHHTTNCFTLLQ